ncbi:MAG: DtxR family transcriptional regulator [Clostridiales bacterium]|nr:DtxR family transcriptional regulator [Clostridiales bacterium]
MAKNQVFRTVRGYQLLAQSNRLLSSAMEDYLEMIYRNAIEDGYVRMTSLSDMLHVKPPSATKMVQKLTQLGFLKYEKYGIIMLTELGKIAGEFLLKRHNTIEIFLRNIGVSEDALVETELMEHNIGDDTLKCIEIFNAFLLKNNEFHKAFEAFKDEYYTDKSKE